MINIKTLKTYCSEDITLIENFKEAINSSELYHCHHRLEVQDDGTKLSRQYLIDNNLYFNRPASELILLTKPEHTRLHASNRSKETLDKLSNSGKLRAPRKWTQEEKQKLSNTISGEGNPFYGKKHSGESLKKMSESHKGQIAWNKGIKTGPLSNEHRLKISNGCKGINKGDKNAHYGKHWYTNGIENICCYECPEGFYKGRIISDEQKQKISITLKNKNKK